jgi:hypothetical protein
VLLLGAGFSLLGTADYAFVGRLEAGIVAAAAVLAHRLLAGRAAGTAASAAAALFAATALVPSAGGAMETPLAMALLAAAVLAMARDRWRLAGALLALGGACRLELFVAAPAALWAAPRGRRGRFAAWFGIVAGVVIGWVVLVYGTALPNTVIAKSVVYGLTAREFLVQVPASFGLPESPVLGLALLAALGLAGVALAASPAARPLLGPAGPERAALVVLGAPPAALGLAYAIRTPLLFPWYWPLLVFPLLLGLALAALRWRPVDAGRPARWLALGALAALAAGPAAAGAAGAIQTARDVRAVAAGRLGRSQALVASARARTYLEIGADLERRCRSASVLAAEIGALGWTYRGRIIDGVGLVSPEVLVYHPLRVPEERATGMIGAYPARAVAALRPDLIVTMEIFHTDFALKAPSDPALSRYAVLDVRPVFSPTLTAPDVPVGLWGTRNVLVLGEPTRCARRPE